MRHWTVFSLLLLVSCAGVERPDALVCVVNAPAENIKCYNLKEDYYETGKLKKSAKAKYFKANDVYDLNKGVWISNNDWAKVKVWINQLKEAEKRRLK